MIKIVPTDDTSSRISADFIALDTPSRISLLARLANWLTLMARDTYDSEGGVADAVRLRAFNEAENRILSQLVQLLAGDDRRYPDDVFANMLIEQFDALRLDVAVIAKFAAECVARKQSRRTRRQPRTPRSAAAALHRLR
jgi:hypothetical protein